MEFVTFNATENKVYIKFSDLTFHVSCNGNLIQQYGSTLGDTRHINILNSFDKVMLLYQQQEQKWFALCQMHPGITISNVTAQVFQCYPSIKLLNCVYYDEQTCFIYGFCSRPINFIRKIIFEGHKMIGTNSPDWIPVTDYIISNPWT